MTRWLKDIEQVWRQVEDNPSFGICLDTCHIWGSGEDPETYVKQLLEIVPRIDLVHANGSMAEQGSGQDRHSPFHSSLMSIDLVADMIRESKCEEVVCESRDPAYDIAELRKRLED